jgi:hypothetical protein
MHIHTYIKHVYKYTIIASYTHSHAIQEKVQTNEELLEKTLMQLEQRAPPERDQTAPQQEGPEQIMQPADMQHTHASMESASGLASSR